MKRALKVLAIGAAFAASVTIAKADTITPGSTISVNGSNDSYTINTTNPALSTITFAPNGTTAGNYNVSGDFGTFASVFTPGVATVTWNAVGSLMLGAQTPHSPTGGTPLLILTVTQGTNTLQFFLDEESWTFGPAPAPSMFDDLQVTGQGTFNFNGTSDPAVFSFSSDSLDGSGPSLGFTSIGTALGATPEPSSLALLGTGLLGVAALARRRFVGRVSS